MINVEDKGYIIHLLLFIIQKYYFLLLFSPRANRMKF